MLRFNDAERAATDPASAAGIDATWHGQNGDTHVVIDLDHDANDWWVTQIRTSDGKGHSMTYDGTFMKTRSARLPPATSTSPIRRPALPCTSPA